MSMYELRHQKELLEEKLLSLELEIEWIVEHGLDDPFYD